MSGENPGSFAGHRVPIRGDGVLAGCALAVRAERHREAGQRQRAEHQAEVAQCDVGVAADQQQADDDAGEPAGDE